MSTINKDEINKFSKIADEWWDINGKFKPLHMFNPIRIGYILDITLSYFKIDKNKSLFKNSKILDIGCGGGLISEPMSRLGLMDVSGLKKVHLVGPDAAYVIDRVTTRNVDKIGVGRCTYAAILNDDGKFIDDCVIYHLNVNQVYVYRDY